MNIVRGDNLMSDQYVTRGTGWREGRKQLVALAR